MIANWTETYKNNASVLKFAKYFQETYLSPSPLCNWYEGVSEIIINNNGLEEKNRELKVLWGIGIE